MFFHLTLGLFFSLVIVCALRGLGLYLNSLRPVSSVIDLPAREPKSAVLREVEL
jgi:hypothetical protein